MKQIKTTISEFGVIQHMAKQLLCVTGRPVAMSFEYKRGGVRVSAPKDFLEQLGF